MAFLLWEQYILGKDKRDGHAWWNAKAFHDDANTTKEDDIRSLGISEKLSLPRIIYSSGLFSFTPRQEFRE